VTTAAFVFDSDADGARFYDEALRPPAMENVRPPSRLKGPIKFGVLRRKLLARATSTRRWLQKYLRTSKARKPSRRTRASASSICSQHLWNRVF
jgi:hypothetical protein